MQEIHYANASRVISEESGTDSVYHAGTSDLAREGLSAQAVKTATLPHLPKPHNTADQLDRTCCLLIVDY